MLHRYKDDAEFINLIADLIVSKYPLVDQTKIRTKVLDFGIGGSYYINWDLYSVNGIGS